MAKRMAVRAEIMATITSTSASRAKRKKDFMAVRGSDYSGGGRRGSVEGRSPFDSPALRSGSLRAGSRPAKKSTGSRDDLQLDWATALEVWSIIITCGGGFRLRLRD